MMPKGLDGEVWKEARGGRRCQEKEGVVKVVRFGLRTIQLLSSRSVSKMCLVGNWRNQY